MFWIIVYGLIIDNLIIGDYLEFGIWWLEFNLLPYNEYGEVVTGD